MLQILKLFIFTIFGSGDVQAWDSYDSKSDCDMEDSERRARFTVAGDTTDDSNENSDNDITSIDTNDSELLLK